MAVLRKCPRCELNYIRNDEMYCGVCSREMRKKNALIEEPVVEICAECNEAPAVEGEELCAACLREKLLQESLGQERDEEEKILEEGEEDLSDTEMPGLREIELDDADVEEIPESELEEIDEEFSSELDAEEDMPRATRSA